MPVNKCDDCKFIEDSKKLEKIQKMHDILCIKESKVDKEFYLLHKDREIAIKLSDAVDWFWEEFDEAFDELEDEGDWEEFD
jgi:hypothetical protein